MILPLEYYLHHDVVFLSRDLLGKYLFTHINGCFTGGIITETEAYRAPEDRASHAFGNRRTKRNEVMFQQGGIAYVYQCYGLHFLLNVVTNVREIPHAILIRSIQPTKGVETMLKRRNKSKKDKTLATGPGNVAQALGVTKQHNGLSLLGPTIWIEDRGIQYKDHEIQVSPRIGVDYAGADALLPWRFYIES